jgi:CsbD-like.
MKGKVKQVAGKISDNPKLKVEGTVEEISGKVQERIGRVKKVFGK